MKHPPLLKNTILSLHYKLTVSVVVMHHFTFTVVLWHALCMMEAGTVQQTVGQCVIVI